MDFLDRMSMLKGGAGSPAPTSSAPAARGRGGWTPINYDESRGSLIDQIRAIAAGRPIYGTRSISNYQDPNNYVASSEADGGDAGTYRTVYRARGDAGLRGNNETGVYFVGADNQDYMRTPLSRAGNSSEGFSARELGFDKDPEMARLYLGVDAAEWESMKPEDRNRLLDNTFFKPDNLHGFGELEYDPERGLVNPTSSYRDPNARHDNWLTAAMMAAVAAPAIAGAVGGAGAEGGASGLDMFGPDGGISPEEVVRGDVTGDPWFNEPGFDPPVSEKPPIGGDNPYGTEIPNEYPPDANPTDFSAHPQDSNWFDRLLNAARGLPSLSQAMGGSRGSGSGGGGSGAGGGGMGGLGGAGLGGGRGGRMDPGNPEVFAKTNLTQVGDIVQYLRGRHA